MTPTWLHLLTRQHGTNNEIYEAMLTNFKKLWFSPSQRHSVHVIYCDGVLSLVIWSRFHKYAIAHSYFNLFQVRVSNWIQRWICAPIFLPSPLILYTTYCITLNLPVMVLWTSIVTKCSNPIDHYFYYHPIHCSWMVPLQSLIPLNAIVIESVAMTQ